MAVDISQLKRKTISGMLWSFGQKLLSQGVGFIVSMILARLLMPDDYGLIAMTGIFIAVASIFADCGLGTSLVQKDEVDHLDYNTVFYAGLALSAIVYLVLFFIAPFVGDLYHDDRIVPILRVIGLNIFLFSINSVQNATVTRNLEYKKFFKVTFIGSLVSAIVGIGMAYYGFGVWALVISGLIASIVNTFTMNLITKWRPKLEFSWGRLKSLYSFGLNLMVTDLFGTFFDQLRGFLIGIKYKPADLAFYNRGMTIPQILASNLQGTIDSVLFPAISKVQNDKALVRQAIRRSMMTSGFFVFPAMFLMSAVADKLIVIFYGSKWIMAIPFMQIISFKYCFGVIGSANLQAMKAIGRSDITLKLEFIKKPIYLIIIISTMFISPLAMCVGHTFYDLIGATINAQPNKKLIGYNYKEQLMDLAPQMLASFVMAVVVYLIGKLRINIFFLTFIQLFVGVLLYYIIVRMFRFESYQYVVRTVREEMGGMKLKDLLKSVKVG